MCVTESHCCTPETSVVNQLSFNKNILKILESKEYGLLYVVYARVEECFFGILAGLLI